MDYKEIRSNLVYVNFDIPAEMNALGKFIDEVNIQNDSGSKVSVAYFQQGIVLFDEILNDVPFYEYGLSFHLSSFENAFIFVLYDLKKEVHYKKVGIWRDQILNAHKEQNFKAKIVKVNKYINMLKSGAFGQGIFGAIISASIGYGLEKIKNVKTEDALVNYYHLVHKDSDPLMQRTVTLYTTLRNSAFVETFIFNNYKLEL